MGIVSKGISDLCGINYDIASGGFKFALTEGFAAVEGIKTVISFCGESVLLSLGKKKLEIKGSGIFIKELCKGYILISGTVTSVAVL